MKVKHFAAIVFALTNLCQAQWLNHPTPGIPRTSDGKPNLAAPAPRTSDGKPDLSGLWQAETSTIPELINAIPPDILRQLVAPGNKPSGNVVGDLGMNKYWLSVLATSNRVRRPSSPPHVSLMYRYSPATYTAGHWVFPWWRQLPPHLRSSRLPA